MLGEAGYKQARTQHLTWLEEAQCTDVCLCTDTSPAGLPCGEQAPSEGPPTCLVPGTLQELHPESATTGRRFFWPWKGFVSIMNKFTTI